MVSSKNISDYINTHNITIKNFLYKEPIDADKIEVVFASRYNYPVKIFYPNGLSIRCQFVIKSSQKAI
jgi:hypothetical protein